MAFRSVLAAGLSIVLALSLATNAGASMPRLGNQIGKHPRKSLRKHVPGEVLVRFKDGVRDEAGESKVLARHGSARVKGLRGGMGGGAAGRPARAARIKITDGMSVDAKMAELRRDADVADVQPNYVYHALAVPNDPRYGQLWGLKNAAQSIAGASYATGNPGTAGRDMNLEPAWDLVTDCSAVTVAVIDTGINASQEDLAANLWNSGAAYPNHGYNFVDDNNNPVDLNGHGTHVAATIGAAGNNGLGTTGVCWKASIMAVKVLDSTGTGTTADITDGITFAVNQGAKVINMSLGASASDPAMEAALQNAAAKGVVVVVAAGNDGGNNDAAAAAGGTPTYPCNSSAATVLCVAALDQRYGLASFSNYGATSVDVGAPGTNVLSATPGAETVIGDTFNTGGMLNWTRAGVGGNVWAAVKLAFAGNANPFDVLANPANWDGKTQTYANGLDARVYKSFNLAGYDSVELGFNAFVDVADNDAFGIAVRSGGGDPFAGGGVTLDALAGTTEGQAFYLSYDASGCRVANCSVGFALETDAVTDAGSYGVGILTFSLTGLALNATSYGIKNGTSMASPHVAGLATMLFAYNPSYSAADVIASIKAGGVAAPALAGKTTTGKAASAYGSLTYIAPVAGVTATVN